MFGIINEANIKTLEIAFFFYYVVYAAFFMLCLAVDNLIILKSTIKYTQVMITLPTNSYLHPHPPPIMYFILN